MSLPQATERLKEQLDQLESTIMPAGLPKLDSREARTDLTSREVAKLIGGMLGSILQMSNPDDVRQAIRWWARLPDEEWRLLVRGIEAARLVNPEGPL